MIPKFRDVLSNSDEMDPEIIANCLKTLNELVHHQVSPAQYLTIMLQETADMKIDADILQLTAQLLKYEDAEVREQASLLLGSFALSFNGRALFEFAFQPLKDLLEDEELKVREAASRTIQMVSVNDDGCIKLVEN